MEGEAFIDITMENCKTESCEFQATKCQATEFKNDHKPCFKHAAQNMATKTTDISSQKVPLCDTCSKTMLSYVFLVQDLLESLSRELCSNSYPESCVKCVREQISVDAVEELVPENHLTSSNCNPLSVSKSEAGLDLKEYLESEPGDNTECISKEKASKFPSELSDGHLKETACGQQSDLSGHNGSNQPSKKPSRKGSRRSSRVNGETERKNSQASISQQYAANQQEQHLSFLYNTLGSSYPQKLTNLDKIQPYSDEACSKRADNFSIQGASCQEAHSGELPVTDAENPSNTQFATEISDQLCPEQSSSQLPVLHYNVTSGLTKILNPYAELDKPNSDNKKWQLVCGAASVEDSGEIDCSDIEKSLSPPNREICDKSICDDIELLSSLSTPEKANCIFADDSLSCDNEETEKLILTPFNDERDSYKENLVEYGYHARLQEGLAFSLCEAGDEAYVTICRSNSEALGCLVLGTSLLLTRTSKIICVLVSDEVSDELREALSLVFHIVQSVRSLDCLGTTKLTLLEQIHPGISFEKLNVWRLVQFSKCVFLSPDTLVIHNCDELFSRDELSAVIDSGWPDCFNSGVFVFLPSLHTFWQLLEFAEKQGSSDGGDQGLLNSYFSSWSRDINKKLSFIYNLTASVSYTYIPAFQQFGRNVKIVQFSGSYKPWHVKFSTKTGQTSDSSVHQTYLQYIQAWITIFRISILRLLSQNIQSYVSSQKVICAAEILRFFPSPSECGGKFGLEQIPVSLQRVNKRLQQSSISHGRNVRSMSGELSRFTMSVPDIRELELHNVIYDMYDTDVKNNVRSSDIVSTNEASQHVSDTNVGNNAGNVVDVNGLVKDETLTNGQDIFLHHDTLPGAEIGNYQGMQAWEQGRMDYEGTDSSENIIKRLQFLMCQDQ